MSYSEILKPIVEKAVEVAEKTGDFVMEQAPLILQEFYHWMLWKNIFLVGLFLMLFIITLLIPTWFQRVKEPRKYVYDYKYFGRYYNAGGCEGVPVITLILGSLAFLLPLLIRLYDLIFLLVAPKLYLIDYILMTGKGC